MLYLTKGAPVIITRNRFVELGLTNGNVAKLQSIKISARDEREAAEYFVTNPTKPYYLKDFPEFLTLDMRDKNGNYRHKPIEGLEPWELPMTPKKTTVTAQVIFDGSSISKFFSRQQYHLCLAFSLTDYKVQERSYDTAIVDLVRPSRGRNSINSLYVMLSRVRTLAGLRILRRFKFEHINMKLSSYYSSEIQRLAQFLVSLN